MAILNDSILGATVQAPPIGKELQTLFANLDDSPLLEALTGSTRRGPKGHPMQVLWHCFVAKYYLSLPSTDALIRTLVNNPWIAQACGIPWPDGIPHKSTFSRFFAKLTKRRYLTPLKYVFRSKIRQHYKTIPGFGRRVALDSTTLKAWSNGGKARKSDKEAGWSVKQNTHGKMQYTYGWKLHLLVDCESELPMAAIISPGNTSDVTKASNVLQQARVITSKFHPRYFMADAGYSSNDLFRLIVRQYRAEPIIQVNPTHKKLIAKHGIWENTVTWKALYSQRQAVERCFSRLKGQRSLNHITVRGHKKVTVHCYLSMIVMQALIKLGDCKHPPGRVT